MIFTLDHPFTREDVIGNTADIGKFASATAKVMQLYKDHPSLLPFDTLTLGPEMVECTATYWRASSMSFEGWLRWENYLDHLNYIEDIIYGPRD